MNLTTSQKLIVSLFQIPEDYRVKLAAIAKRSNSNGQKISINTCIIEALENYLNLALYDQSKPVLPKGPLRAFTVRTSSQLKHKITHCAATWQLKSSYPVSMNAIVNTSILRYLENKIQGCNPL